MSAPTLDLAPPERPAGLPLLPVQPQRMGPVTRFLVLRMVAWLVAVQAAAALLVFVAGGTVARAVGLSLALPGGGFLYAADPILFVVTWIGISLALVLWWGVSAHLALPLVWLASALGSGLAVGGPRLLVPRGTTRGWAVPVTYALALLCAGAIVASFDCAQVWVRLVRLWCRVTRRPQVTCEAPPMPPVRPGVRS